MKHRLNESVSVVGVGCTRFGDLLETEEIAGLSLQELASQAAHEAYRDAGLSPLDVDTVFVGNVMVHSSHMPATYSQISKWIGTELRPGVHFDAACTTTNTGVTLATQAIASGAYETALVIGLEATRNQPKELSPYEREPIPSDKMWLWTDMCVNQAYSCPQGYEIFSTYNGILAQAYCRKYGISIEEFDRSMFELAKIRRLHGSLTPKAFIQETLEDEAKRLGVPDAWEFWQSRHNPFVSWPSRLRSVVTPADGASAILLARTKTAQKLKRRPIEVAGFATSVTDLPWYDSDPTDLKVDGVAIEKAFKMAHLKPREIGWLHTHDCSHIASLITAERIGYLEPGTALRAARDGKLRFDGDKPMTTHGGRHSFGHAWAASAGSDTYEAVKQLRGEAGKRQVKKPIDVAVVATHGYALISNVLVLRGL